MSLAIGFEARRWPCRPGRTSFTTASIGAPTRLGRAYTTNTPTRPVWRVLASKHGSSAQAHTPGRRRLVRVQQALVRSTPRPDSHRTNSRDYPWF